MHFSQSNVLIDKLKRKKYIIANNQINYKCIVYIADIQIPYIGLDEKK